MAAPAILTVLREAVLELGARGARAERKGQRPERLTLDVDSMPIEIHGHQPKAEWNGHYHGRIYHPLITSVAETGDMLDARLRPGNVSTAEGALDVILDAVDRAQASLCNVAMRNSSRPVLNHDFEPYPCFFRAGYFEPMRRDATWQAMAIAMAVIAISMLNL